jgi:hypothetical protein
MVGEYISPQGVAGGSGCIWRGSDNAVVSGPSDRDASSVVLSTWEAGHHAITQSFGGGGSVGLWRKASEHGSAS